MSETTGGSVYRRGDGKWCATVDVGMTDGKRKRRTLIANTRNEALAKLAEFSRASNLPEQARQTIHEYLADWLTTTVASSCAAKTITSYEQMIRLHITPTIGHITLGQLTPAHVQEMISSLRAKDIAPRTVQYAYRILTSALNRAVKYGYIERNVASLVDTPKNRRHQVEPFTREQAQTLLAAVEGHRLQALYHVALVLGLRQGELIALKWDDVNLERKQLHVRQSKTDAGVRVLALPAELVTVLLKHRERQRIEQHNPRWREHGLVFPSEIGTPLGARNLLRHYKHVLDAAGLPNRRFHDLRHTCASLLIEHGVNPRVVMEILGHSQIAVTMNIYAHVFPSVQADAVAGIADMLHKNG